MIRLVYVVLAFVLSLTFHDPAFASQKKRLPPLGVVYAMTNASSRNEIVVYRQRADGSLRLVNRYSTGVAGSGPFNFLGQNAPVDPLRSQNSLILSPDRRFLIAANAGSNRISVFRIISDKLVLVDTVDSRGRFPVSLTILGPLVYVLNAGDGGAETPIITTFFLAPHGELWPIVKSTRRLDALPAQIGLDPWGNVLVMTMTDLNQIRAYPVSKHGRISPEAVITESEGFAPFGFTFHRREFMFVTEARTGAVSSYRLGTDGSLEVIKSSARNHQEGTCWITSRVGRFAYVSNTESNTLTGYRVFPGGFIKVLGNHGVTARRSLNAPIDLTLSGDRRFVHVLNAGSGTMSTFRIGRGGSLSFVNEVGGLPSSGAQGIVAW